MSDTTATPELRERKGDEIPLRETIISKLETATITALQALLILLVVIATLVLYVLFVRNLVTEAQKIDTIGDLLPAMQRSFAGVLIVLLGLELLETLKVYFTEHHIRLEVILLVAIIAVSRHVIQVDFEHTPGIVLIGLSAVILSLTVGYFLIKRVRT